MAQAMSFSEKGEKMELSQLKIPTHVSIMYQIILPLFWMEMDAGRNPRVCPGLMDIPKEQMYLWISVRMRMHLELNI